MGERVVGSCAALVCVALGGFLSLGSFFALRDGKGDFYLPLLLVLGVGLVVGGLYLTWNLARPKPVKRPELEEDVDEGW